MTVRSIQTTLHFSKPFDLSGFDRPQPAGDYRVDHYEQLIDGLSRPAWQRIRTFIHLPAIGMQAATYQIVPTTLAALGDAVTIRDDEGRGLYSGRLDQAAGSSPGIAGSAE